MKKKTGNKKVLNITVWKKTKKGWLAACLQKVFNKIKATYKLQLMDLLNIPLNLAAIILLKNFSFKISPTAVV